MTSAVSRLLKDFGAPERTRRSLPSVARPEERAHAAPAVDIEAERAAAYEEGWRAAAEESAARHAQDLAAREAKSREALAALARSHEQEMTGRIANALSTLVPDTTARVSDQLAGLLAPILAEDVTRRMVEAFARDLEQALGEEPGATVTVSGPRALFDRLAARLEGSGIALTHVEAEAADLSVELDGTTVETRLAAWTRALSEALS